MDLSTASNCHLTVADKLSAAGMSRKHIPPTTVRVQVVQHLGPSALTGTSQDCISFTWEQQQQQLDLPVSSAPRTDSISWRSWTEKSICRISDSPSRPIRADSDLVVSAADRVITDNSQDSMICTW